MPITDKRHLVIDIGGGSTELIIGAGLEPVIRRSLKIGHVRLTDRFFPNGIVDDPSIELCRTFIKSFLAEVASVIGEYTIDVVVGSSGTFETVATIARTGSAGATAAKPISRVDVAHVVAAVCAATTSQERAALDGVEPHRADTIVAGAILVETLMETLAFSEFVVSPDALREGLLLDRLDQGSASPDTLLHLNEIRGSSVVAMAERYGENVVHARQATDIALRLFDSTQAIHEFAKPERDVLEAAAMLHNIGRFIGHAAHHKHSYYLIRNGEQLAGFNEHERELIAIVARYHRKSAPKPSHEGYAALNKHDKRLVSLLAGMLRIGIGLDRTYRNVATDIAVNFDDHSIDIAVDGFGLEIELFAANERKFLLERALQRKIDITQGDPTDSPY